MRTQTGPVDPLRSTLLGFADVAAAGGADAVARAAHGAAHSLGEPMRLAVAGQIKRGKSTLVNALLGEDVVATGQLETTYVVNELVHDTEPSLTVHYRSGPSEELPVDALHRLTVRDPDRPDRLKDIRKVERCLPNDLLTSFRLVDTPGLGSAYGHDSANSVAFLGISDPAEQAEVRAALDAMGRTAEDVDRDSLAEMKEADAVLFLFSRMLSKSDEAVLARFTGADAGVVSGLNAFGVLNRCDENWPPGHNVPDRRNFDPVTGAARIVDRLLTESRLRRMLHTLVPVAGLVAYGAQTLPAGERQMLDDLAHKVPVEKLWLGLRDTSEFAGVDRPELVVPTDGRRQLVRRLSAWGIWRACTHLRDHPTEAELTEALLVDSGVATLRATVVEHFGRRARVLKLDSAMREVRGAVRIERRVRRNPADPRRRAVDRVHDELEQLAGSHTAARELELLNQVYRHEHGLSADEVGEILRVTGEHGPTVADRLGLADSATLAEFRQAYLDGIARWAAIGHDGGRSDDDILAARHVVDAYQRIGSRVRQAERLLLSDEL